MLALNVLLTMRRRSGIAYVEHSPEARKTQEKHMNYQNSIREALEQKLILSTSRLKMLLGLAGSLAFVAIGIWILPFDDPWHFGMRILCIGFFGLGVLVTLVGLVRPFPVLIVNDEVIQQPGLFGNVFAPWEEIDVIRSIKGSTLSLCIYLSESR